MKQQKVILGIGNPGKQYQYTRHNLGFTVVDKIAKLLKVEIWTSRYQALITESRWQSNSVLLVKPLTYVNLSGQSAKMILDAYQLLSESLLVVVDDVSLPLGKVRIRRQGSSGGHNGLQSLIDSLQTLSFPRLRVGIGQNCQENLRSYVLDSFTEEENELATRMVNIAAQASITWLSKGVEASMNEFNHKSAIQNHMSG